MWKNVARNLLYHGFDFYCYHSTGLWLENTPTNLTGIENTVVSNRANIYVAIYIYQAFF